MEESGIFFFSSIDRIPFPPPPSTSSLSFPSSKRRVVLYILVACAFPVPSSVSSIFVFSSFCSFWSNYIHNSLSMC